MPAVQSGPRIDEIARKWYDLAERRLAYYTELYRSGRWQHYYTQQDFAVRMLDVIRVVKTWGDLASQARARQPVAQNDDLRPAA